MFHHEDSIIDVVGIKVGGQNRLSSSVDDHALWKAEEMMEELRSMSKSAGGSMLPRHAHLKNISLCFSEWDTWRNICAW